MENPTNPANDEVIVVSSMFPNEFTTKGENQYQIVITFDWLGSMTLEWSYNNQYPKTSPKFSLSGSFLNATEIDQASHHLSEMFLKEPRLIIVEWVQWLQTESLEFLGIVDYEKQEEEEPTQTSQTNLNQTQNRKKSKKKEDVEEKPITQPEKKISNTSNETEKKRPHMRTSEDVFNRIKWDTEYNSEEYKVGYEDRFVGLMECEFTLWESRDVTEETFIPWHRVVYFKRGEEIVWDRRIRLDNIFGSTK